MFKENSKAIYLQIADGICDDILAGLLPEEERLPSVREYAARLQVNPNTMMRAYDWLSSREVIFNRRGIGYFVAHEAQERIKELRGEEFLGEEIFGMFRQLQLLGISPETLKNKYEEYLKQS